MKRIEYFYKNLLDTESYADIIFSTLPKNVPEFYLIY